MREVLLVVIGALLRRGVPRQQRQEQTDLRFIQALTECGHLAASANCDGVLQSCIAVTVKPYVIDEARGVNTTAMMR